MTFNSRFLLSSSRFSTLLFEWEKLAIPAVNWNKLIAMVRNNLKTRVYLWYDFMIMIIHLLLNLLLKLLLNVLLNLLLNLLLNSLVNLLLRKWKERLVNRETYSAWVGAHKSQSCGNERFHLSITNFQIIYTKQELISRNYMKQF